MNNSRIDDQPNVIRNLANMAETEHILRLNENMGKQFSGANPGDILHVRSRILGGSDFQATVISETKKGDLGGYTAILVTGQQRGTTVFVGYHDIIRIDKPSRDEKGAYV